MSETDLKEKGATGENDVTSLQGSSAASEAYELNPEAEKKLVRRFDLRLMPVVFLLYLLCFIDRVNIGNARIAGLEKDLKLHGFQFNIALTVFYLAYTSVEVPSNLIAKRVGPHYWIPFLVICFGLVSMLTAFVTSFGGLVVARIALGIAEGGVMPGITHYLSRFYRRSELVFRIGVFVSSATLAGAFGGLLASGLLSVDRIGSVVGWRNIFLVEGLISIVVGLLAIPILAKDPESASFLSPEERRLGVERLRIENANVRHFHIVEETKSVYIWRAFLNINNWLFGLGFLLTNISVQGLSLFAPTITRTFFPGKTTVQVQLRTVPPFLVAWVWSIFLAWISDRFDRRAYAMLASIPFAIAGYAIFIGSSSGKALYAAMFLVTSGIFPQGPFFLAWAVNSSAPDTMRAVSSAFVVSIGTLGAIIATWSYLPNDAPKYHNGNSLNLASTTAVMTITVIALLYSKWENKQRKLGRRDYRLEGLTEKEEQMLGSKHPRFMYSF